MEENSAHGLGPRLPGMVRRTLLLLRHGEAGDPPPGGRDPDRRLTPTGEEQARAVGPALAGVSGDYDNAGAGADTLIAALREVDPECRTARLEFDGKWADLETAALVEARLPAS